MRRRKGLTLVELLLTLALVAMVIPLAFSVFLAGTTSHSISTSKGFAQQDIRIAADFLVNELKFVTDISEVEYEDSEYYSLRINNEGNLVKIKHIHQDDDSVEEEILRTISGNSKSINITNNESGVIQVNLEQVEKTGSKEAGFELAISINTENAGNMINNISIELLEGDILYYKNTSIKSLANSIYLQNADGYIDDETVTVRFYRNEGIDTILTTITSKSGKTENLPVEPKRSGYTFSHWNTNIHGSGTQYGSVGETTFNMPSNHTDLYAIWVTSENLKRVSIATDGGIVSIDGNSPKTNSKGHFKVKQKDGSHIRIKLLDYTSSHKGKVSVTVKNSTVAVEDNGYITFKAVPDSNGNKKEFKVDITIVTDGYDEFKKTLFFITAN